MLAFIKIVREGNREEGRKWAAIAKAKASDTFFAEYLLSLAEETADGQIEKLTHLLDIAATIYPRIYIALASAYHQKQ